MALVLNQQIVTTASYCSNRRESIFSAVYLQSPTRTRVAQFPFPSGTKTLPYALHTMDEYSCNPGVNGGPPSASHAIAFRAVDLSVGMMGAYGGGKLGIYSHWDLGSSTPTMPDPTAPQQFEFYDYSASNQAEVGNDYFTSPNAPVYLAAFNTLAVQNELYAVPCQLTVTHSTALNAFLGDEIPGSCKDDPINM